MHLRSLGDRARVCWWVSYVTSWLLRNNKWRSWIQDARPALDLPSLFRIATHGLLFLPHSHRGNFQQTRASRLWRKDQRGQAEVAYYKLLAPGDRHVKRPVTWRSRRLGGGRDTASRAQGLSSQPQALWNSGRLQAVLSPGTPSEGWVLSKIKAQLRESCHSRSPSLSLESTPWPFPARVLLWCAVGWGS